LPSFNYLIEKILNAPTKEHPFPHIYIENFFDHDDFQKIISTESIHTEPFNNDQEMFDSLFEMGYKIIDFPGCITSTKEYISWHKQKEPSTKTNTSCEGFGLTLRLINPQSELLLALKSFIESEKFITALASRFNINLDQVDPDNGIQKYLDGYEISPHPDVRKKALTYMVNINPHNDSEELFHHTQYLQFKKQYEYITQFWNGNPDVERCWVPWDWCESIFTQNKNNSFLMFSPSSSSMHAVKANYNHLKGQRTQLYGNLWYKNINTLDKLEWESLVIGKNQTKDFLSRPASTFTSKISLRLKKFFYPDDLSNYEKITRQPDDYK